MDQLLRGYSRALSTNWLWHRRLQVVVDAGEGLAEGMAGTVLQPTHLLVTHGHSDHVLGLPGFVAARRFGLGDPEKPLTIVHPEGSRGVRAVRDILEQLWPGEAFPLRWVPVQPGARIPLDRRRDLEAFAATHPSTEAAVGYRVVERRRRLRPDCRDLSEAAIQALAAAGRRNEVMEEYGQVLFAHTGDSMPLDPALFADADLLVHDATFLDAADRREPAHATAREALDTAREARVARLVLQHLSVRYPRPGAWHRLEEERAASGFAGECWLLDGPGFRRIGPEGEPAP